MGVLGPAWVLALLLPDSAVAREGFSKGQTQGSDYSCECN